MFTEFFKRISIFNNLLQFPTSNILVHEIGKTSSHFMLVNGINCLIKIGCIDNNKSICCFKYLPEIFLQDILFNEME